MLSQNIFDPLIPTLHQIDEVQLWRTGRGLRAGGIAKKPEVIGDKIEIREYLYMTVSIDHDLVAGAPAARFISRLAELVENGYGLTEE